MEALDDLTKNMSKNSGFFNHVFDFSNDSKDEISNIVQYAVLAIIPVVVLNKLTQKFVPEADDEKGNVELLAEVVLQIVGMFVGMLIIHRMITYIPTQSGVKYSDFNVTSIVLATLVIVLSLQTKLGEKVSILVERVIELWEGPSDIKKPPKNAKATVKVTQPISQNQQILSQTLGYTNTNSTPISQLPVAPQITKPVQQQQNQEYINMYRQENTMGAMQNNSFGGQMPMMDNEPMAANFGGSSFGSSF